MRIIYNIGLAAAAALLLTGCFSHIYDVTFLYDNDAVIVPSEGGTYFFEVEAGKRTKTSFEDRLMSFEYRINIDGNVIDQQIVNISHLICTYTKEMPLRSILLFPPMNLTGSGTSSSKL